MRAEQAPQRPLGAVHGSSRASPCTQLLGMPGSPTAVAGDHRQPLPAVEFLGVLFSHDVEAVGDGGILRGEGVQGHRWHGRDIEAPPALRPTGTHQDKGAQLFALATSPCGTGMQYGGHVEVMEAAHRVLNGLVKRDIISALGLLPSS